MIACSIIRYICYACQFMDIRGERLVARRVCLLRIRRKVWVIDMLLLVLDGRGLPQLMLLLVLWLSSY